MIKYKERKIITVIVTFIVFLSLLLTSSQTHAQTPEITNGLTWLKANQNADGSWGAQSAFRDTTSVIDTFNIVGESDVSYADGINWIGSASVESNDYIARRVISLAGTGADVTADMENFDETHETQYHIGGWGSYTAYQSNAYDTALVLHAFHAAQFESPLKIARSINYLVSEQNDDGSWSMISEAPGDVATTALVSTMIKTYGSFSDNTAIDRGIAWLKTKQNPDGGFGSSPSTVRDTALALNAIMLSEQLEEALLQNALNYITLNQLPDGSWSGNAYETSMAVRILGRLKPNISIFASDFIISNEAPKSGEVLTITAAVRNTGGENAENIAVQIFAESPANELVQLGTTEIIPVLSVGASSSVAVDF